MNRSRKNYLDKCELLMGRKLIRFFKRTSASSTIHSLHICRSKGKHIHSATTLDFAAMAGAVTLPQHRCYGGHLALEKPPC